MTSREAHPDGWRPVGSQLASACSPRAACTGPRLALVRAEHDPDRRVLVRGRQLALVVVDIHLHLPEVLVRQLPDLEVQQDEGAREPVVEHQVDEEMLGRRA